MTTLPQTTPVRVPRPASGMPLAGYGGGAPAAGGMQLSGADIWRLLRANLWLMALLLTASLLAGYGAYRWLLQYHPRYTARGMLLVDPTPSPDPIEGRAAEAVPLATEIRSQMQMIKNEGLYSRILSDNASKTRQTAWFASMGSSKVAKEELEKIFQVIPIAESRVLRVEMTMQDPGDAQVVLKELLDVYLGEQSETAKNLMDDRTKALKALKGRYAEQLDTQADTVRQARYELERKGMGANTGGAILGTRQQALIRMIDDVAKLRALAAEATSRRDSARNALQENRPIPEVERSLDQNSEIFNFNSQMHQLQIERDTQVRNLGLKHPKIQDLDRRIDNVRKQMDDVRAAKRSELTTQYLTELDSQVASTDTNLAQLQQKVQTEQEDLAQDNKKMADLYTNMELERAYRQLFQQASDQLDRWSDLKAIRSQSRVTWYQQPERPELPSFPKPFAVMGVAAAIGLILSVGVAFLRELMDETVRSPRDIAKVGQMNLLGIISDENDDPQAAGSRLPLVIFDAPHSLTAEQFRQVRTRLQHAASLDTTRSIMVTGPSPMDGKTTVACNLAAGLALNGRKILLVDANFRRPELHRIFDLANDQGFAEVLNGLVGLEEAIRETQIPNLSVLVAGTKPVNPTELFESQLLIDFIDRALEEYDHVIFDSGPFLVVSESVAMAPRVDGVVTVVRAHEDSRGLLQRMRDDLRRVKAEHLGVVLNAVRAQGGGYYGRNIKTYYEYQNNEG